MVKMVKRRRCRGSLACRKARGRGMLGFCAALVLAGVAIEGKRYVAGELHADFETESGVTSRRLAIVSDAFIENKSRCKAKNQRRADKKEGERHYKKNADCNRGMVIFHILGVIYMFLGLMIVCDNFFGPALDVMVERWSIDDDVAGATFMAAGGSAPELATSFMGRFVSKSDVGFGTIVGSAVFNVLFVIGLCALVVPGGEVPLTWWPLFRDCSYYIVGLAVLAVLVSGADSLNLWESFVLFAMYLGYVTIMFFNEKLERMFTKLFGMEKNAKVRDAPAEKVEEGGAPDSAEAEGGGDDDDEWENPWEMPDDKPGCVLWVICLPLNAMLYGTLPDVAFPGEKDGVKLKKPVPYMPAGDDHFLVTFFACLLWLVIFSYLMVVWVTVIGAVFGISDYIMGLTILASGTSIPDALSSMYMAKEGRGDMAISSSIGSNVFDILVGLPVPTIVKYVVVYAQGNNVRKLAQWNFDTDGIVFDTVLLLMMVALILTSIMLTNWVLNMRLGTMMFVLYFVFLVVCILNKVTGTA